MKRDRKKEKKLRDDDDDAREENRTIIREIYDRKDRKMILGRFCGLEKAIRFLRKALGS